MRHRSVRLHDGKVGKLKHNRPHEGVTVEMSLLRLRPIPAALAVACSLAGGLAAQQACAQATQGSVTGTANGSEVVQLLEIDTGRAKQVQAKADGGFSFTHLPPGRYKLWSAHTESPRELVVTVGGSHHVDLTAAQVEVRGNARRMALDMSTTEDATVFTKEQIRALPVAQSVRAVALLAPGTVEGAAFSGGLPSFRGASVAENGYYINGFDVTNIRDFMSFADLPFDAIEQQQVKTGGYGAEYGRALGGIVSIVTQRGGKQWKGGAFASWEPSVLHSRGVNQLDKNPQALGGYTRFERANTSDTTTYAVYGGGPLIEGQLFGFGMVEGRDARGHSFGRDTSTSSLDTSPHGMFKLDWLPGDNHHFEFTAISNRSASTTTDYTSATLYSTVHDGVGQQSQGASGGQVWIGKYTGSFGDALTASVLLGQMDSLRGTLTGHRVQGQDCPEVREVDLSVIGCWVPPRTAVRDPDAPDDRDLRRSARLDLDYTLGHHALRAGAQFERFQSWLAGTSLFSGGIYHRYFVSADGTVNGVANAVAPGGQYVRSITFTSTSGMYAVENAALYLEDSWQATRYLMLYGGLRNESFDNQNAQGQSFVKAKDLWAPRLGFAWDAAGDASLKVFGSAGRYFIPVASNTNARMTQGQVFETHFYTYAGRDLRTQAPFGLGSDIGTPSMVDTPPPNPATVADPGLRPMNQDEFILGLQRAMGGKGSWVLGAKGVYRRVNDGMDDFCGREAINQWAHGQGHASFNLAQGCLLMNPGKDLHMLLDLNGDGQLSMATIPAANLGLAPYKRFYRALELSAERPFDGVWGLQASYTWSHSFGTAEGYVQSTLGQTDAGITQDFDFASFTHGAFGDLPNDRRHAFKLFGNVALSPQVSLGANATITSGRPTSCIGFVPPTVSDFAEAHAYTAASSYYCLQGENAGAVLVPRGTAGRTPWIRRLDLQLAYTPTWASNRLTLQADLFNVLNSQGVTEWDQQRDYTRDTAMAPPYVLNQNYQTPKVQQAPRFVRLTARWGF